MSRLPWEKDRSGSTWPKPPEGVEVSSPLHYALRYVTELDWSVFPVHWIENGQCSCKKKCKSPGKHPITVNGFKDASRNQNQIIEWWKQYPKANIGAPTGKVNGFFAIDLDKKDGIDGAENLAALERENLKLPDSTVQSLTGSGGMHILFQYPLGEVLIPSRTNVLAPCIDVRADNGYIIVEPSVHISGRAYGWEASSEPWDTPMALAPHWIVEKIQSPVQDHDGGSYVGYGVGFLTEGEINDLRSALTTMDADDRSRWVDVGHALKSTDCGETAYALWEEWSKKSDKYDAKDMAKRWRGFKPKNLINKESIFYLAQQAGWQNPLATRTLTQTKPAETPLKPYIPPQDGDYPNELLKPPGILQAILDWSLATAHKPQPHLLLQAAFASVSAITARRYRTNRNNWSSLYFLNIAKSASGKEHCKTAVEQILEATGNGHRIGGAGYTSSSAVFSALMEKPAHIALIDEMGRFLQSTHSAGNHHRVDAITQIIEMFGRCHGAVRPVAYSTMSLNKSHASQAQNRKVLNPALAMLGITTPGTFYDSISLANIKDGFLGRFIICESPIGRALGKYPEIIEVPDHIVDWGESVSTRGVGNLAGKVEAHDLEPTPNKILISDQADKLFRAFESEVIDEMNRLDDESLDVLLGRTVEKAIRLSILCALAESSDALSIRDHHAEYAIKYVRWHDMNLIRSVRLHVADSPFGRIRNQCLEAVRKAGTRGLTARDMNRTCRPFMCLKPREQNEVLESLSHAGLIELQDVKLVSGAGRKRRAWVAVEDSE